MPIRLNATQILTASGLIFIIIILLAHFGTDNGIQGISSDLADTIPRVSLKAAMARSEVLWEKSVAARRAILKKDTGVGFFPVHDVASFFATPYSVWDLIPATWNCPHEVERIGRMGDGGKWVCGFNRYEKTRKPCIVYSFGIQNESSFENDLLERTNCQIWGYDPNANDFGPNLKTALKSRAHFTKAAIAGTTDTVKTPPKYTIQDILVKNGHDYIDILKLDIEYWEFESLNSLLVHSHSTNQALPIGQLLIEIHLFETHDIKMESFVQWWDALEDAGMRPTWTEPNLLGYGMGLQAQISEYTMVNIKNPKNKLFRNQ